MLPRQRLPPLLWMLTEQLTVVAHLRLPSVSPLTNPRSQKPIKTFLQNNNTPLPTETITVQKYYVTTFPKYMRSNTRTQAHNLHFTSNSNVVVYMWQCSQVNQL